MKNEFFQKGSVVVSFVLPFVWLTVIIFGSLAEARDKARDARRESDMRQISLAMEMYYDEDAKYVQSEKMPTAIGYYLDPVPQDPGNGPCSSYKWISNMTDSQQYCAWACFENGGYFAASEKGTKKLDKAPTNLACW